NISTEGDLLDFHLTFRLEKGTDKITPDVHFALRRERTTEDSAGRHKQGLYWFYRLTMDPKTRDLYWLWTRCAGQGDPIAMCRHFIRGVNYGSTAFDVLTRLRRKLLASTQLEYHCKAKRWTLSPPS